MNWNINNTKQEEAMPRFREAILKMGQYSPPLEGRATGEFLLLDFNEMTTPPSNHVLRALDAFAHSERVQIYPEYGDLDAVIAAYAGCASTQVLATNGSDQGIDIVARAFVDSKDTVIIPSPSFAMHYQAARLQGARILTPRYLWPDFAFPFEETMGLIDQDTKLVVLCNPNNPLGTAIPMEQVRAILQKTQENGTAVLHDEAYFEFCGITAIQFLAEFDNLFITRTLSKQFGIASLRPGYVISHAKNIEQLLKIRGPYDVNMMAAVAIKAALEHPEYAEAYIREVMQEAKPLLESFLRERGIPFVQGVANFLLVKPSHPSRIVEGLKSKGILVRPREDPEGTVRVTIGTLSDTARLLEALASL